jgi:predicted cupin superfamily sugar epimerase
VTVKYIINKLGLKPLHAEGGFFFETYRSTDIISKECLPGVYINGKNAATAIYYLLEGKSYSHMHQLPTDEIYHYYYGSFLEMLLLYPNGSGEKVILGCDFENNIFPQIIVPRGTWHGSRLVDENGFCLLGTTMAPAFDFSDYIHGDRISLINQYPQFEKEICELTTN